MAVKEKNRGRGRRWQVRIHKVVRGGEKRKGMKLKEVRDINDNARGVEEGKSLLMVMIELMDAFHFGELISMRRSHLHAELAKQETENEGENTRHSYTKTSSIKDTQKREEILPHASMLLIFCVLHPFPDFFNVTPE